MIAQFAISVQKKFLRQTYIISFAFSKKVITDGDVTVGLPQHLTLVFIKTAVSGVDSPMGEIDKLKVYFSIYN